MAVASVAAAAAAAAAAVTNPYGCPYRCCSCAPAAWDVVVVATVDAADAAAAAPGPYMLLLVLAVVSCRRLCRPNSRFWACLLESARHSPGSAGFLDRYHHVCLHYCYYCC